MDPWHFGTDPDPCLWPNWYWLILGQTLRIPGFSSPAIPSKISIVFSQSPSVSSMTMSTTISYKNISSLNVRSAIFPGPNPRNRPLGYTKLNPALDPNLQTGSHCIKKIQCWKTRQQGSGYNRNVDTFLTSRNWNSLENLLLNSLKSTYHKVNK